MDLRQIQYFVALYEEQSITKAARRLHVVQPAVSMQIRRLEIDYNVSLFERTPHGVYPNEVARRLYPLCIDILGRVEGVRQALKDSSGLLSGTLAVGIPPSIAHGVLADVLRQFHERNPDVKLAVHEGYSANLVDWLIQGDLDFAILSELEEEKRLRYRRLVTEELKIVIGTDTPFEGGTATGADLNAWQLILPSSQNLTRILIETEFERVGLELSPAMELDSLATVFAMLRQPGWATILPASALLSHAGESGMRCLSLVQPTIQRTLVAAFPALKPPMPAAEAFIDMLEDTLASARPPRSI
jgi:DNA-binding transcriptional LysR family regulator